MTTTTLTGTDAIDFAARTGAQIHMPKTHVRPTMYGDLHSFSCARCCSYVSDERPSPDLAAVSAFKRGAVLRPEGFFHARCVAA